MTCLSIDGVNRSFGGLKALDHVTFTVNAIPSGDCNVRPFLYVEPRWEIPANDTDMRETT